MIWIALGYWICVMWALAGLVAFVCWVQDRRRQRDRAKNVADCKAFNEQLARWRDEQELAWARDEARMLVEVAVLERHFRLPPSEFSPLWER